MLFLAPQLLSFAPSTGGVVAASRRLALHRSPAPLATYDQDEAICATDEVICATVGDLTSLVDVQADGEAAAAAAALREILGEAEEPLFEVEDEVRPATGDVEKLTIPQLKELLKAKKLPVGGKKAELVARLAAATASPQQDEVICATDEVICATVGELDAAAAPAAAKVDLDGLFGGVEEGEEAAVDDVIANSDVDPRMVELLAAKGIVKFTPIQIQSYALLRSGADMLGRSQTGTGKTLAFALPMMQRVQDSRAGPKERGRKTAILVLAPTRELARQVAETFEMLARPDGLSVSVFHGGTPYGPQQRALRDGLDVIVGTPGRIIDHLQNGDLDLSEVQHVVLDEADEMLNMGFKVTPTLTRTRTPTPTLTLTLTLTPTLTLTLTLTLTRAWPTAATRAATTRPSVRASST